MKAVVIQNFDLIFMKYQFCHAGYDILRHYSKLFIHTTNRYCSWRELVETAEY